MTDVFVSYTREDAPRVAPIVAGLRKAGLSVWWDGDISAGENWRTLISEHLDAAKCAVVVWTARSVTAASEFVHEEAGRAKARGVLLPVRLDRVREPIGFGHIQSVALVGWRSNPRDRRFRKLVVAAQAMAAGRPRPPGFVPGRFARLAALWAGGFAAVAVVLGFAADLVGLQNVACRIPVVHAACASFGWGGVPTKSEEALLERT